MPSGCVSLVLEHISGISVGREREERQRRVSFYRAPGSGHRAPLRANTSTVIHSMPKSRIVWSRALDQAEVAGDVAHRRRDAGVLLEPGASHANC